MADTKLSALTELAATPADTDEVYIRDVSEAASAESKRITIANLLAGAGGATLTVIAGAGTEVFDGSGNAPRTWTDLDLHSTIGEQATLVVLKVYHPNASAVHYFFRQNGDGDDFGLSNRHSLYTGSSIYTVPSDTSGIIEWKMGETTTGVTVDIIAYIK